MLVVDTSVLLAAADNADPDHEPSTAAIQNVGPLVTTALVVAETAYLIGRQLGAAAEATFFRAVADGELQVEAITPADARRIAELIDTYADLGLGGTDASLVVIAERLNLTTIATLDRRHFGVLRPRHAQAFELSAPSRQSRCSGFTCSSSSSSAPPRPSGRLHRQPDRIVRDPASSPVRLDAPGAARIVSLLIRDRDNKFTCDFDASFASEGIRIVKAPVPAPKANAIVERFVRTARTECLDWLLIMNRRHLERVLRVFSGLQPPQGAPLTQSEAARSRGSKAAGHGPAHGGVERRDRAGTSSTNKARP